MHHIRHANAHWEGTLKGGGGSVKVESGLFEGPYNWSGRFADGPGTNPEELVGALKEQVRHVIGPIANPDEILMVEALPKTRSGKIMRRILRQIAAGEYEDMGNVSTLADPSVVEALIEAHKEMDK